MEIGFRIGVNHCYRTLRGEHADVEILYTTWISPKSLRIKEIL